MSEAPKERPIDGPRRFVVVGAGGVGSWLLAGLARMCQYRLPGSAIIIVDGDSYEPKNLERQDFETYGNKAVVKATELQPQFPEVFIIPEPKWVVEEPTEADEEGTGRIAASELLEDGDIVYAVVDNFAARKLLFDAGSALDNIDIFTGGNDDGLYGSVYHFQRRDGVNVTDHPADYHPELIDPPDRNPGAMSCGERAALEGSTQLLATNMAVAAILLGRTQHTLLEGRVDEEAEIFFDLGLGMAQPFNRLAEVPALIPTA